MKKRPLYYSTTHVTSVIMEMWTETQKFGVGMLFMIQAGIWGR
jgi:hypothetical protein